MNPTLDLLGEPMREPVAKFRADGKPVRKPTPKKGYAARPGSGPQGMKCKDCIHLCHTGNKGKYLKCFLLKPVWTHGPGTDILANSPACSKFEAEKK